MLFCSEHRLTNLAFKRCQSFTLKAPKSPKVKAVGINARTALITTMIKHLNACARKHVVALRFCYIGERVPHLAPAVIVASINPFWCICSIRAFIPSLSYHNHSASFWVNAVYPLKKRQSFQP